MLDRALLDLFAAHGIRLRPEGDWLAVEGSHARVRGIVQEIEGAAEQASTQVDIVFSPWPGTLLAESFGGFGETLDERIRHALGTFARNTLHVLLTVFLGADCGDSVGRERIINSGIPRLVTHGDAACAGDPDLAGSTGWWDGFLDLLATHPIPPGIHWVRLFCAQLDRRQLGIEILLDNERWSAAEPALREIVWPAADGYFSIRMFLVVQGGIDLAAAVGVFALHPQSDDEEIRHLLTHAGLPPVEAHRASITVPLAFGRELLDGIVTYPETCEVRSGESGYRATLASVPGFREAAGIAKRTRADGSLTRDQYVSIAMRDALAKAVNDALTAGHDMTGASAEIVVLWPEPEPFGG